MAIESRVITSQNIITAPSLATGDETFSVGGAIVSPNGPVKPTRITSPAEFLAKYTTTGTLTKADHPTMHNAYALLQFCDLVLSRSVSSPIVEAIGTDGTKVLHLEGKNFTHSTSVDGTIDDGGLDWSFKIGGYGFYKGVAPAFPDPTGTILVEVTSLSDVEAWLKASSEFEVASLTVTATHFEAVLWYTESFNLTDGTNFTIAFSNESTPVDLSTTPFLIVPNSPFSTDEMSVEIVLGTGAIHTLIVNSEEYLFSLTVGTADEFGRIVYIDYINDLIDIPFTIEVLDDTVALSALTETSFGATLLDANTMDDLFNLTTAIDLLVDQEEYRFDMMSAFGHTTVQYTSLLNNRCGDVGAFQYASIPSGITSVSQIKNYVASTNIDSKRTCFISSSERNISLLGFEFILAGGVWATIKAAQNRIAGKEFAPMFSKNHAIIPVAKLTKVFTKTERESLLDDNINSITYRRDENIYYINDNRTKQVAKNMFSEDQNVRISNKIIKDLEIIYEQFLGQLNTPKTRADVEQSTKDYFRLNITSLEYGINDFIVQCDDENNPTLLIEQNKLAVRVAVKYNRSIKFVEVLNQAYALSVEFE